jgi:outer membrane receptor for Fe3+-dicitrate
VVSGGAGVALAAHRVVQARTAGRQVVDLASGRVAVALAGQTFEFPAPAAVATDVTKGAILARESSIAGRAETLFDPSGPFDTRRLFRSDIQFRIVQPAKLNLKN